MTIPAIAPVAAQALVARGEAVVLDLRAAAAFAPAHPAGAISLPFSARGLAARARVALPAGPSVILVASDEPTAAAAAAQLAAGGPEVRAVLEGGLDAWREAGLPVGRVGEVVLAELPRLGLQATVIDVREPLEWTTGHVPGARLIPLGQLRAALSSIPRAGRVIAICEAGVRSCTAASILAAAGFPDVAHVPAGSSGYRRSGLPLAFAPEELAPR